MKRFILLFIVCVFIFSLFSGCDYDNNDIHETPANQESFSNLEDFLSQASQVKSEGSAAKLNELNYFFLPDNIPKGYSLYKIGAGTADIGFFYLPDEYTHSQELIWQGESERRHFLFISSRGIYTFDSVLRQHGASIEDLIDGKYLVVEKGPRDIIIWEQDSEVLMLYVPAELNYTDVLACCTASKYVRNEENQTFELEEKNQ